MWDESARTFLHQHHTATLATAGPSGEPQACTVFYVVDLDGTVLFKSRSLSDHMQSLRRDDRAGMAIYRPDSSYKMKAGLQLKGRVVRVSDPEAMTRGVELYSSAFSGARERFAPLDELLDPEAESTLYRFVPSSFKLTDGWTDRTDLTYTDA